MVSYVAVQKAILYGERQSPSQPYGQTTPVHVWQIRKIVLPSLDFQDLSESQDRS